MAVFWTILYNMTCVCITAVSVALAVMVSAGAAEAVIRAGKGGQRGKRH